MNSSYAEDSSRIYREWPYLGYPAVPGFESEWNGIANRPR